METNQDNSYQIKPEQGTVEIFTFGRFLIQRGGQVISASSARSEKVWLLFKYLLTHREMAVLPETMLETLWPGKQYRDPNLAVRSLIHRLRSLLKNELAAPELASNIVFSHSCYRWTENRAYRLDVEEFEELIAAAGALSEEYPGAAVDLLNKAKRLYLGAYLPECSSEEWVLPARNYYHQLYVKSVILLADLLKGMGCFAEIIELCRDALEIEYFEEKLHLYYLEALLEEGKTKKARLHYEDVTAAFYLEMGAKPSEAMRLLFSRIQFDHEESFNLNLSAIQEHLKDHASSKGALLCDPGTFRYFYQLEMKRMERSGQQTWLALLALSASDFCRLPPEKLREAAKHLSRTLRSSLRKGDIICQTHEAQYLILLPNCNEIRSAKILTRIEDEFRRNYTAADLALHKRAQPLTAEGSLVLIKNANY